MLVLSGRLLGADPAIPLDFKKNRFKKLLSAFMPSFPHIKPHIQLLSGRPVQLDIKPDTYEYAWSEYAGIFADDQSGSTAGNRQSWRISGEETVIMRIEEITITNLFGIFDHSIEYKFSARIGTNCQINLT